MATVFKKTDRKRWVISVSEYSMGHIGMHRGAGKRATGLEPATFSLEGCKLQPVTNLSDNELRSEQTERAAPGAAPDTQRAEIDPDLALVIGAWPELPEPIKRAVLALVKA